MGLSPEGQEARVCLSAPIAPTWGFLPWVLSPQDFLVGKCKDRWSVAGIGTGPEDTLAGTTGDQPDMELFMHWNEKWDKGGWCRTETPYPIKPFISWTAVIYKSSQNSWGYLWECMLHDGLCKEQVLYWKLKFRGWVLKSLKLKPLFLIWIYTNTRVLSPTVHGNKSLLPPPPVSA